MKLKSTSKNGCLSHVFDKNYVIWDIQSLLKHRIKELIYEFVWKKFSKLENYFDFYWYICIKILKYGTETFE